MILAKSIGLGLVALGLAVTIVSCTATTFTAPAVTPSGLTPAERDAAVRIALHAPAPHAVDVTAGSREIGPASVNLTLAAMLEGRDFAAAAVFPARIAAEKGRESAACVSNHCMHVQIYNFSDRSLLLAVVDMEAEALVDLTVMSDAVPALSDDLAALALQVASNDPAVKDLLAGASFNVSLPPMSARREDGACAESWCVVVSLDVASSSSGTVGDGDREGEVQSDADSTLLVLVDLGERRVEDVFWQSEMRGSSP